MRRVKYVALAGAGVVAASALNVVEAASAEKPNIVLILLDDVGYSDFGCYGSEIDTPNIDRLAEQGLRLRSFYNQARSAPTRASMITGLYPHQVGNGALGKVKGYEKAYQGYPNEKNAFIPEVLKSAGYFTAMTGKWHLGFPQGVTPVSRGFDRSLNAPFGGYYFSNDMTKKKSGKALTREKNLYLNGENLEFDDSRLPKSWYSTHLWTDFGLSFIDEAIDKDKPFFWYLAHNGAHFPLQAPQKTIDKYKGSYSEGWEKIRNERFKKQVELGLFDEDDKLTPRNPKVADWESLTDEQKERFDTQMAVYAAIIDELDQSIGKIMKHLEKRGELENTMFILLSDNGGNAEPGIEGTFVGKKPGSATSKIFLGACWADVANTPYFMYKHHGHEGGCNTPFIISYPKGIDQSIAGTIRDDSYGHVIDIMPTLVELSGAKYPTKRAGYKVPAMEGVSLLPLLSGESMPSDRAIIMEHEGNKMCRKGDWKVVQEYSATNWNLYNLKDDPTEMNDLATKNPSKLKEMMDEYKKLADYTGVEGEIEFKVGKGYTPVEEY